MRSPRAARVAGDGLFRIDKPSGPTSRTCVDRVIRRIGRRDAGHAGTLDPFATGLLLVLHGRATRLVPWIHEWPKEYRARIRLGRATDTLDRTGVTLRESPVPAGTMARLPAILEALTGEIEQAPPMVSAARVGGRRLHELAREGIEVEREAKTRVIHRIDLLATSGDVFDCDIRCSSGTYIRSLAETIGERLGLPAHLEELRRTAIGPWRVEEALDPASFESLDANELGQRRVALEAILDDWPLLAVDAAAAAAIAQGRMPLDRLEEPAAPLVRARIVGPDGRLVALVEQRAGTAPKFLRVFPPEES